jgi:hypothetical protein
MRLFPWSELKSCMHRIVTLMWRERTAGSKKN